jgi:HSP20 family molecular chaperone IbpA
VIYDDWPLLNIYETETSCIVVCEVAGMAEDDFSVTIKGNNLLIGGRRQERSLAKETIFHCYEIKSGPFKRSFWIPHVNIQGEDATYQNGFLKVVVPLNKSEFSRRIDWEPSEFYMNVRRIATDLNLFIINFGLGTEWPLANMYETEESQVIICEIAGMKIQDFRIDIDEDDDMLIIHGDRHEPIMKGRLTFHCLEIPTGPFRREFPILKDVDRERIQVAYENGFLKVTIPKIKFSKEIPVEDGD